MILAFGVFLGGHEYKDIGKGAVHHDSDINKEKKENEKSID